MSVDEADPWGYQWSFWQQVRHDVELPDGWLEIRPDPAESPQVR